jgi:hypothetical protein
MYRKTMRYLLLFLMLFSTLGTAGSIYLGNDKDGLALSPKEAIEIAKPYLYESFKSRVLNGPQTEQELWNLKHLRTYVLLDGDYYLVTRSLPKKLLLQYENHAVWVRKFTGEVLLK